MQNRHEFFAPNTDNDKSRLDATAYAALTPAQKNDLIDIATGKKSIQPSLIIEKRSALPVSLAYYHKRLAKINRAQFARMTPEQLNTLNDDLLFMLGNVFLPKFKLDVLENKSSKEINESKDTILKCISLIHTLDHLIDPAIPDPLIPDANRPSDKWFQQLSPQESNSDRSLKYLGLNALAYNVELQAKLKGSSGITKTTRQHMGLVNGWRLYWVWGGGSSRSLLDLLPKEWVNLAQTRQALAIPADSLGYMSFMLYYARFLVELSLLIKHVIEANGDEANIPWLERLNIQWQQRKFILLNDLVWGTVNLACFFWLTGPGTLGYIGNVVTLGLLLMDLSITIWARWEARTQYLVDKGRYEHDIALIGDEDQKHALEKAFAEFEFEARYQHYQLILAITYAAALVLSFSVAASFFLLPGVLPLGASLLVPAVGAALCFASSLALSIAQSSIAIMKDEELAFLANEEALRLHGLIGVRDDDQTKLYYLDMLSAQNDKAHHDELAAYKKVELAHSVVVQLLIPPVLLSSLLLLPLTPALSVFAATLVVALIAHSVMKAYDPSQKALPLPEFNEDDYNTFLTAV